MNWNELESRFFQAFAESIDTESCIEQFGEARSFYGLTQVLARAARGKMPEKSAVNYAMGIMRNCTEKEASAAFRKESSVSIRDIHWYGALKEKIRDLKLEGVTEIKLTYLDEERSIPITQLEGVMESYSNRSLDIHWQHWLRVVMLHLLLSHLYTPQSIEIHCAREYRDHLPEVEAYHKSADALDDREAANVPF